jgi:hypothetical protein
MREEHGTELSNCRFLKSDVISKSAHLVVTDEQTKLIGDEIRVEFTENDAELTAHHFSQL